MCTLPCFNTCLFVSSPLSHYASFVFNPFAPTHALFPSLRSQPSLPTYSSNNCYPRPVQYAPLFPLTTSPACLPLPALPRFTGRQPCSALLVTRPVLVYRPPALLALLATHPALLYWPPAMLCCFAGPQPCSALLPAALLCFTGHQPCSALLATKSALLYWLPALARPYWPRALLYSSGHQSCSALLATSLATCWPAWPRPPPPTFSACHCSAWALHYLCLLSHTLAATTGGKKA